MHPTPRGQGYPLNAISFSWNFQHGMPFGKTQHLAQTHSNIGGEPPSAETWASEYWLNSYMICPRGDRGDINAAGAGARQQ